MNKKIPATHQKVTQSKEKYFLHKYWLPLLVIPLSIYAISMLIWGMYIYDNGDPFEPEFCGIHHTPNLYSRVTKNQGLSGTSIRIKIQSKLDDRTYIHMIPIQEDKIYYKYLKEDFLDAIDRRSEAEEICLKELQLTSDGDTLLIGDEYFSYDKGRTFQGINRLTAYRASPTDLAIEEYFRKVHSPARVGIEWSEKTQNYSCKIVDKIVVCTAKNVGVVKEITKLKTETIYHDLEFQLLQDGQIKVIQDHEVTKE